MKILFLTAGFHHEGIRNAQQTGYALCVEHLAEVAGRNNDVYVYNTCFWNDEIRGDGYTLVRRRMADVLKSVRPGDVLRGIRYACGARGVNIKRRIELLKYFVFGGYADRVIRRLKPDAIHIHGLLWANIPMIVSAARSGCRFMLTAHGLYSLSETVALTGFEKKFEFDALRFLARAGVVVSVVSSGMKKVIEQHISGGRNIESLKVVLNPVKAPPSAAPAGARRKRIVCAGTLSPRKNQGQLIRALALIAPATREGLEVMFAGRDTMGGGLQRLAVEAGVDNVCRFPGQLPRERMLELMGESHCVAMMSLSEGFGLPVAEGYSVGLPALFFSDVDAAADFDDPGCALVVDDHSDAGVAKAVDEIFAREWDRDHIRRFSGKFSEAAIAGEYARIYSALASSSVTSGEVCAFLGDYFCRENKK